MAAHRFGLGGVLRRERAERYLQLRFVQAVFGQVRSDVFHELVTRWFATCQLSGRTPPESAAHYFGWRLSNFHPCAQEQSYLYQEHRS